MTNRASGASDGPPADDGAKSDIQTTNVIRISVSNLMCGNREAMLEHNGQTYRLRITASGKLILTK